MHTTSPQPIVYFLNIMSDTRISSTMVSCDRCVIQSYMYRTSHIVYHKFTVCAVLSVCAALCSISCIFLFSSKNNYTVKRIHIRHFSLHNTDKREMLEFTPIQEKKLSSHGEYLENIYFPKSHVHQLFYFDLKY